VSDLKVTGLHPKLADTVSAILNEAKARGFSVGLHSGLRTFEEQDKLYELGRTIVNPDGRTEANPRGNVITKTIGGFSWHNYGLAADIVFKDSSGNWTWNKTHAQWDDLGRIGEMFDLDWGGRWSRFPDYPHFQILGRLKQISISAARKMALEKGIEELWKMV